jgi:hypothetical protein
MQGWVNWWCQLIGITDPTSAQIATGIVGGGTMIIAAWCAIMVASMVIAAIFSRPEIS